MTEGQEKTELLKELVERAKSIEETLKDLVSFFRSIEEMNLGDDDGYLKELEKDRFHPPMG